jgi:hypothetical protein
MKKNVCVIGILVLVGVLWYMPQIVSAQSVKFTISRMVVSSDVQEKEPVGIAETFPASTEKVYCFVEARDIAEDTNVGFVWYYEDREVARVQLPLKKGIRWRTYSSKRLAGLKGNWKVELHDADGNTLHGITFKVE